MPFHWSFAIVPPTPEARDQDAIVQQLNILPVADLATYGIVKIHSNDIRRDSYSKSDRVMNGN
jgi:hypothetical protein